MKNLKTMSAALLAVALITTQVRADEDTPTGAKVLGTPFTLAADAVTLDQYHNTRQLYNGKDSAEDNKKKSSKRKSQSSNGKVTSKKSKSKTSSKSSRQQEDQEINEEALS